MKILHAGILHSPNLAIGRAMIERGHHLKEYDCRATKDINGTLVMVAREWIPDLVFMQIQAPDIIAAATCDAMRDTGALVVHWNGDVRENIEWAKQLAPHVDITSFTNETDNDIIRALGHDARYLQIGYDDLIYNTGFSAASMTPNGFAQSPAATRSGIVFMGNDYKGRFPQSNARKEMVERMKAEFGDAFTVYGNGWGKGARHLSPHQEAEAYNNALIAVGMDHFLRPYFASDRLLRSQACGACVVQQRYPGFKEEHRWAVGWSTLDDLVAECRHFLASPESAMSVGADQAKHTFENHRWHNRVEVLEKWVDEHKKNRTAQ
jgi:CheY-like chemotaxis protein